jgi:hypothetical protein
LLIYFALIPSECISQEAMAAMSGGAAPEADKKDDKTEDK